MPRSIHVLAAMAIVLATSLAAAGCVTTPVTDQNASGSGVEPLLVIERFLHAANVVAQSTDGSSKSLEEVREELQTMARLFGTRKGPIRSLYPRGEVEQRMMMIASILEYKDYEVEGEALVPGRVGEAIRLNVRLVQSGEDVTVPFTLVKSSSHGWLVEKFDAERITAGR